MIDGNVLQSSQKCFEKKSRVVVKMVIIQLTDNWNFRLTCRFSNFLPKCDNGGAKREVGSAFPRPLLKGQRLNFIPFLPYCFLLLNPELGGVGGGDYHIKVAGMLALRLSFYILIGDLWLYLWLVTWCSWGCWNLTWRSWIILAPLI